jgi:type 1 fimbria pilin
MKKLVLLAASFCTALALYSIIFADPPKTISFQGRITDNFGNPITEVGNFEFTFNDGVNSAAVFSTYSYVNRGLYSVNIDVTENSLQI